MSILATCKFHGVGQGLFYTSIIRLNRAGRNCFTFVYDCGTTSKNKWLKQEIRDFADSLPKKNNQKPVVDLLVISHFHADHINGLQELLKKVSVNTVVLPYTPPDLLLLYAASEDSIDLYLRSFYSDPISTLTSFGVRNIIQNVTNTDYYRRFSEDDRNERDNDNYQRNVSSEDEIPFDFDSRIESYKIQDTQVDVVKNLKRIRDRYIAWVFKFRNLSISPEILSEYRNILRANRKKGGYADDSQLINDPLFLRRLRDDCDKLLNLNRMSLMVCHAPAGRGFFLPDQHPGACSFLCRSRQLYRSTCGTMLTGDIEFLNNEMPGQADDPQPLFDMDAGILQVPHHGSIENWEGHNWCAYQSQAHVISYGISNKYGHPDNTVIHDSLLNGSNVELVNEGNSYSYYVSAK